MRHPQILQKGSTALLVVDIQEKLVPSLPKYPEVEPQIRRLIQALRALKLPILLTEQYPKGLGQTLASIKEVLPECRPIEKVTFSCCGQPEVLAALSATGAQAVVVAGVEAHVCVQQTTLDLIAAGYRVHIPADAICSRRKMDWQMAVERMRDAGAVITTSQSVIFELLERAGTPEFREVLPLLREE
jgi:nicotinamidase-related amidase